MHHKRYLLFFVLLLSCSKILAAVFVVTSNADSGPGTFRDALIQAAANGSAVKDYINFNIADVSEAGRSITILSALPVISSNLVIDGSTQPGLPFGVSNAKVAFLFDSKDQFGYTAITVTNQTNLEFYGLYFKLVNLFKKFSNPVGISISGTNNVQFGDVGKGNVFAGFFNPLLINNFGSESTGFVLKSNFFSIQPDGLTVTDDFLPSIRNVYGDMIIGGETPAEGNLFAKGIGFEWDNNTKLATLFFKHNLSGVNYNLTAAIDNATVELQCANDIIATKINTNTVVNMENNIICSSGSHVVSLGFTHTGGPVNILRNYFNVDKSLKQIATSSGRIYIQICREVHIGSSDVNDANYVGYSAPIFSENSGTVGFTNYLTVTKNSFFCTTNNQIYYLDGNDQHSQCYITKITANSLTGTATPNAEIELYYSDICKTCAPQRYFASVTADANGNWAFNGTLSGTVIANATYNNSSSEFTKTEIITDNIKITQACGGLGSITGATVHSAATLKWLDEQGNVVGTEPDLLNAKAGKYRLAISNGECIDTSAFQILSKFDLDTSRVIVKNPVCGDSLGYVTGLNPLNPDKGTITYAWTDAGGKLWSDSVTLKNVPAGTYSLVAISSDTCTQTYGPVLMPDQNDILVPPSVNSIKLCLPADAVIRVLDTSPGSSYRLYQSAASSTPVDEQPTGAFNIKATKSTSYYVSRFYHNCESARTLAQVDVSGNLPDIANTFTPNGDGVNDYWKINNIEDSPAAVVQIFNRGGQLVYHSIGYAVPFNGTYNGKALPAGVYYYTIGLSAGCKLISGSLTLIR